MALLLWIGVLVALIALVGAGIAASPLGILLRCVFGSWADRCNGERRGSAWS